MKGKGKCKSCHTLGLWCGNATCTRKEIWNGFIKLRYTLGNTVKVCWFQNPAGSLEMHWNESIVQFLMDDLWKQNSNVWHDAWGMTRLPRMECGFSKFPKFQWSLLKIFRLYEIKIKGEKHIDMQPSCEYFGLSPSQFFFFLKVPTRSSGKGWAQHTFLEVFEPQRKACSWGVGWKQTWVGETLWVSLQTTVASQSLAPTLYTKECNSDSSGPISLTSKGNTNWKGSLGKLKARRDWDLQMARVTHHQSPKLVTYWVLFGRV